MIITNEDKDFFAQTLRESMDTPEFIQSLTKDGEFAINVGTTTMEPYGNRGDRKVTRYFEIKIREWDEDIELTKEDKNELLSKFTPDLITQIFEAIDEADEAEE